MADGQDRGGLSYPIETPDNFSSTLTQFKSMLEDVIGTIKELNALSGKGGAAASISSSTAAVKAATTAAKQAVAEQKASYQETTKYVKQLERDLYGYMLDEERRVNTQRASFQKERIKQASDANKRITKDLLDEADKQQQILANKLKSQLSAQPTDKQVLQDDSKSRAAELKADADRNQREQAAIKQRLVARAAAEDQEATLIESKLKESAERQAEDLSRYESYETERVQAATEAEEAIQRARAAQAQQNERTLEKERADELRNFRERMQQQAAEAAEVQRRVAAIKGLTDPATIKANEAALESQGIRPTSLTRSQLQRVGYSEQDIESVKKAAKANGDLSKTFEDVNKASVGAESSGSRLLFTFRRLFGVLALFTVARQVVSGFTGLVKSSIDLNAELEQNRLGIAALIVASGGIRDQFGQAESGAFGLSVAMKESVRQSNLLRRDALQTAASYKELLETFQVGIGPGLKSGLNLDEIREFTIRISQASTALGQVKGSLSEEVRSILGGTINRNTVVANNLGITNEGIKRAKEAGTLAVFLQQKFAAFAAAGKDAEKTYSVLFNNLNDAIEQAIQSGGLDFFLKLKSAVSDLLNLAASKSKLTGLIEINPGLIAAIQAVLSGLGEAVDQGRLLAVALGDGSLLGVAKAIGTTLAAAAVIIRGVVQGLIQGTSDIYTLLLPVRSLIEALGGDVDLGGLIAQITRVATIFVGIQFTVSTIAGLIGLCKILTTNWTSALNGVLKVLQAIGLISKEITAATIFGKVAEGAKSLRGLIASLLSPLTALIAYLGRVSGLATLGFGAVASAITAVIAVLGIFFSLFNGLVNQIGGSSFVQTIKTIAASVANTFESLWESLKTNGQIAFETIKKYASVAFADLAKNVLSAVAEVLGALGSISSTAAEAAKNVQKTADSFDSTKIGANFDKKIDALDKAGQDVQAKLREALRVRLADITGNGKSGLQKATEDAGGLAQALNDLPAAIASSRDPLAQNVELVKQFRDELEQAVEQAKVADRVRGASQFAAEAVTAAAESEFKLREQSRKLDQESLELVQQRVVLQKQLEESQKKLNAFNGEGQQEVIGKIAPLYAKQVAQEKLISDLRTKRYALENSQANARPEDRPGIAKEIESLDRQIEKQQQIAAIIEDQKRKLLSRVDNANEITTAATEQLTVQQRIALVNAQQKQIEADRNVLMSQRLQMLNQIIRKQAEDDAFNTGQQNRETAVKNQGDKLVSSAKAAQTAIERSSGGAVSDTVLSTLAEVQAKRQQITAEIQHETELNERNRVLVQAQIRDLVDQASKHGDILNTGKSIFALFKDLTVNDQKSALLIEQKNQELLDQNQILLQLRVSALNAAEALSRQLEINRTQFESSLNADKITEQLGKIREAFGTLGGDTQTIDTLTQIQSKTAELNVQIKQEQDQVDRTRIGYAKLRNEIRDRKGTQEDINAVTAKESAEIALQNLSIADKTRQLQQQVVLMGQLKDQAQEDAIRQQNENLLTAIQNTTQIKLNANRFADEQTRSYIESNGQLSLMKAQLQQATVEQQKLIGAGDAYIKLLIDQQAPMDVINAAIDDQNAKRQAGRLAIEAQTEALRIQAQVNEENRIKAEGTPGEQAKLAGVELVRDLPGQYQQIFDVIKGTADSLASTISSTIVDAFDPTKEGESIKERFASLMRDIAKIIIDQLVKIAVVKSIAFAFGANSGGEVPKQPSVPAQGFAAGGTPKRPAGLHPSDTIPAWLTPGEWVLPVRSVMTYGRDVMEALRHRLIDPMALRGLAGVRRGASAARMGKVGYADGGEVLNTMSKAKTATGKATAGGTGMPERFVVVPMLVASEQNSDTIIRGGTNALLDFMERNATAVNQRLGK